MSDIYSDGTGPVLSPTDQRDQLIQRAVSMLEEIEQYFGDVHRYNSTRQPHEWIEPDPDGSLGALRSQLLRQL